MFLTAKIKDRLYVLTEIIEEKESMCGHIIDANYTEVTKSGTIVDTGYFDYTEITGAYRTVADAIEALKKDIDNYNRVARRINMKIELNKKYVTRRGDIVKCFYIGKLGEYECACINEANSVIETYMLDGLYDIYNIHSPGTIEKEYKEPKEQTVYMVMYDYGAIAWFYTKEAMIDVRNAVCIRKVVLKEGEFDCNPVID